MEITQLSKASKSVLLCHISRTVYGGIGTDLVQSLCEPEGFIWVSKLAENVEPLLESLMWYSWAAKLTT